MFLNHLRAIIVREQENVLQSNQQPYGDRIRMAREMRDWSIELLANKAGLTKGYCLNLEHSRPNPSLKVIEQISDALNVSPAWIAFGRKG